LNEAIDLPCVYADFNGGEFVGGNPMDYVLRLTGYGTLASLARQGIRLVEGMRILFFEPNDIEAIGVVFFDRTRRDPAGREGEWVARIESEVRDTSLGEMDSRAHPCFRCRQDLRPHLSIVGQQYRESCPSCSASVMAPMAPPDK